MAILYADKLDNPCWYSLSETHASFSVMCDDVKFYQPDYCPFGAFNAIQSAAKYIDEYSSLTDNFYVIGERPLLSGAVSLKYELICLQMLIENNIETNMQENIVALTGEHANALQKLVDLVQPGYFKKKTHLLGSYFGILKNNELVAVAGERMQMNDFIEVSAIVTHPAFTGRGFAKQLIAHTVSSIFKKNKTPYLHVVESNTTAISLYKNLGFKERRKMSFWNISKTCS